MARGRMISKCLSTSRKYAALYAEAGELGEFCQVLFPLLVAHADDFGRLPGDVFTVRHLVLPISPRPENEFSEALRALDSVGLIHVYERDDNTYLQIIDFEAHQVGLHHRSKSKFPKPAGNSRKFPESSEQLKGTKQNLTEENLTQQNGSTDTRFQRFWSVYPKKRGKDEARKAFEKRHPDDALTDAMIAAVGIQAQSSDWLKDDGQFIPFPATWLNRGQWQDETTTVAPINTAGRSTLAAAERVKALLRKEPA